MPGWLVIIIFWCGILIGIGLSQGWSAVYQTPKVFLRGHAQGYADCYHQIQAEEAERKAKQNQINS